jgi:cell division septal protein FtsQ
MVKWERGRGRRTLVYLIVLGLCAIVAFLWLRSTDVFDVRVVTARGTEHITKGEIASITSEVMGESLLSVSTDAIEEALLALPYVESAAVHRGFPNTLEIEVVECSPVARLQGEEGEVWLLSDSGRALEGADASDFLDLPLLVIDGSLSVTPGGGLPALVRGVLPLAVAVRTDDLRTRLPALKEIAISAAGCVTLVLEGGGEVRLGSSDELERKLAVAVDVVQQCLAQDKVIEYVDASVVDRVAVKAK